jgi:hypothetical protein
LNLSLFVQQILNGLTLGSIYALVALGLTLVYGILHIPNFSHGALFMAGAYAAFFFIGSLGANYWLALIGAAAVTAMIAFLSERLIFSRLRDSPPLHDMIAAIGFCSSSKPSRMRSGAPISAAWPRPSRASCGSPGPFFPSSARSSSAARSRS